MAFDSGFCRAVATELDGVIKTAKVEKVVMPSKEVVMLSLYVPGKNRKESNLIISVSPSAPMLMLGSAELETPSAPSGFCMLLRKHLTSGRISGVAQLDFERVLVITFERSNELGYGETKYLCIELMGKYSNVFLLDGDKRILGCLKSADLTMGKRLTIVGAPYENPPPQDKANLLSLDRGQLLSMAENVGMKTADSFIVGSFLGISPLVARELCYNATGRTDTPVMLCVESLCDELLKLKNLLLNNVFTPVYVLDRDEVPFEYSFMPIFQYGSQPLTANDFSELQYKINSKKNSASALKNKRSDLNRLIVSAIAHSKKKLRLQTEELKACEDMDVYKNKGELITSYIYMLKQGQQSAVLFDYTSQTEVKITLDPKLSPSQNAQKYFKKYRKKVSAAKNLTEQTVKSAKEIEYLESVLDLLSRAETERELEDIRDELSLNGYVSQSKKHSYVGKTKKSAPLSFTTTGGYEVYVGKNNLQNDSLTFSAAKDDIWFHVKNMPGSHVILYAKGEEPSEQDYTEAAQIAAVHSSAANSPVVAVDYTQRRNVKKPAGSKPGYVTYDKYWTAYVKPDEWKKKP